jgi:hypothetical protein
MLKILILFILILTPITYAQENYKNTILKFKNIEFNFITPQDWKIIDEPNKNEIIIKKNQNNFLKINLYSQFDKSKNTICYDNEVTKELDSRFYYKEKNSNANNFATEYIFKKTNSLTSPVIKDYKTNDSDLINIETINSKAFYTTQDKEFINILPSHNQVFPVCIAINNNGNLNISNNMQYIISSQTDSINESKIIKDIVKKSSFGQNLFPDLANQTSAFNIINQTLSKSTKSNVNIFILFFSSLTLFAIFLLHITRKKRF